MQNGDLFSKYNNIFFQAYISDQSQKDFSVLMNKYTISVLQTENLSIKLKPSASDNDRNVGQRAIPVAQICC